MLTGLEEEIISLNFCKLVKPLANISETIQTLHAREIECIVVTVGPIQVAKVASDIWGFDGFYGSGYEVLDGRFTGRIHEFLKAEDKIDCVREYCQKHNLASSRCLAVGDGSTDIPVFEFCGRSIAINASDEITIPMISEIFYRLLYKTVLRDASASLFQFNIFIVPPIPLEYFPREPGKILDKRRY